jgi:hypothetical protein
MVFEWEGTRYKLVFAHLHDGLARHRGSTFLIPTPVRKKKPLRGHGMTTFRVIEVIPREEAEAGRVAPTLVEGVAYCSRRDSYNKEIGRSVAIGEALKRVGDERLKATIKKAYQGRRQHGR